MPSYKKYWSKDLLFRNEHFPSVMSRESFETIMRFFNFAEKPLFENDWLSKPWKILDHLNKFMLDVITLDKDLSIDKSMMLWRVCFVFRQYIKNKSHKYGLKFYELFMHDGLVLTIETYGGQSFNDEHNHGQTAPIVLKLTNPFLNKGYNSVALTEFFSKKGTYVTGTLKKDRKGNPKEVIAGKPRKGEMVWRAKEDVVICKWKDKHYVLTILNAHTPQIVTVTKRLGKEKENSSIVRECNDSMSGIDHSDQMLSYPSGLRKTLRWYKTAGVYILEIFITNAFYLAESFHRTRSFVI